MDTIVLKFGGSSVANNEKLQCVANKIINLYNQNNNVVVVVSAQGKTTDRLIKEALELTDSPNAREMDVLLSTGEQVTIAKLSILLNSMGYNAISLTGWQAKINTNEVNQDAIIKQIDTSRIKAELEKKNIVIVAGFQGINALGDITTLGRGGSDTTAVAIASALKADACYIYSDVDGIYSCDPNKVPSAKKLDNVSYEEMLEISSEGAKVLHNRCIEIAEKYNIPIEARSTFDDKKGSVVGNIADKVKEKNKSSDKEMSTFESSSNEEEMENSEVKSIVKKEISRISLIGHGIISNDDIYKKAMAVIEKNNLDILTIDVSRSKIAIVFKNIVPDSVLNELHEAIIK